MEVFVAEVRKREYLWNTKKIPVYKQHKSIRDELWQEVAKACKISKQVAKCKWRSLRDNFVKELKKVPVYSNGDTYYIDEREKPRWVHFNHLIFLLNAYTPKQKVIDINAESIIDIRSSDSEDGDCSLENSKSGIGRAEDSNVMPQIKLQTPPDDEAHFQNIRKIYALEDDVEVEGTEAEAEADLYNSATSLTQWPQECAVESECDGSKNQLACGPPPLQLIPTQALESTFQADVKHALTPTTEEYEETYDEFYKTAAKRRRSLEAERPVMNEENENLLFFRSLLPYMRNLDAVQQLRVRTRFQEILMEELAGKKD
ncbi:uncharacterized protein LOC101453850 [Ceratitis capitata]|uniref:uncharacterized protein LOC101453850 n=1 Tax=Ceratitis capitata TaxID=7213 RepID=UPI00032A23E1|nr:uncharacterized protein LOC101453850 [Ceratitis capitata]